MNWETTTNINRLKGIESVVLGPRHNPVNHGEALDLFQNRLADNNIKISKQNGMLSQDLMKYIFTAEVMDESIPDYAFTLGFINFNNKKKSFTGLFGETVFVCSNEMFRGETIYDNRRHTANVWGKLTGKMDSIIERFKIFRDKRFDEIERMKNMELDDADTGKLILQMHREGVMSNTNISRVVKEFDFPTHDVFKPRTLWSFSNACTEVAKNISDPNRRMNATNRIGEIIDVKLAA
jgi:hypothetical protein